MSSNSRQGTGAFARLGIGAQVLLSAALALVAVLLVNWLVGRPGIRQRFDLTAAGRNTLATATLGALERLPDKVKVEILYQPLDPPNTALGAELMARVEALLALMQDEADGKLDVEVLDLSDRQAWAERALELRIQGFENGLVVSRGDRRTFVSLVGQLAQVTLGDPRRGIAPSVASFTAEEALVEALLDVTRGDRLNAYFTFGFGELDVLDSEDEGQAGALGAALEREGFRIKRWNPSDDGPLPADVDVLGILGPTQAWPDTMRQEVELYLARGGRAIIAAAADAEGLRRSSVPALVEAYGIQLSEGTLMRFVYDAATGKIVDGRPQCTQLDISAAGLADHPMLRPFRAAGRGFLLFSSHHVRRARQLDGGLVQVVAAAPYHPELALWLDTPPIDAVYDDRAEQIIEGTGAAGVMATAQAPPSAPVATPLALEAQLETRLVVLGTATGFMSAGARHNLDLWRAVFNWATDRDHRVTVSPRDPDLRMLPRDDPEAIVAVVRFAQYGLPGAALLIALVIAFLRSRGGPSARKRTAEEVPA